MGSNKNHGPRTNEDIRSKELRVIGPAGEQLGVLTKIEALAKAVEYGLDLVEISPNAAPPVAKIVDWGKYKYELAKKNQEQKKKNKPHEQKTVKLSLKIGQHDFDNKLLQTKKFLEKGHRVKVTLFFKGREITHPELGQEKINLFVSSTKDFADVETQGSMGREIFRVLTPKK